MKARLIVTTACNRDCMFCPNEWVDMNMQLTASTIEDLLEFDEIIVTGGEPMLRPERTVKLVNDLREAGYVGKIYVYSAYYVPEKNHEWFELLFRSIDGMTYSLHYDCIDSEVANLGELSRVVGYRGWHGRRTSYRLNIAENLYEQYDFGSVDLMSWDVVKKLKYIEEECPLPLGEVLVVWKGWEVEK